MFTLLKFIIILAILGAGAFYAARNFPIETMIVGDCDNAPTPVRLSKRMGDSIEEASEQLDGAYTCPTVELQLYLL